MKGALKQEGGIKWQASSLGRNIAASEHTNSYRVEDMIRCKQSAKHLSNMWSNLTVEDESRGKQSSKYMEQGKQVDSEAKYSKLRQTISKKVRKQAAKHNQTQEY